MKRMELKFKNENNNKEIIFYFKNNRIAIDFVDGNEPEVGEAMNDYINNFLKKKGYKIIEWDIKI